MVGRVIIVLFYGLFLLFSDILGMYKVALFLFIIFLLLLPWLVRQAIRFRLKSTSYRNIRFSYRGRVRDFYILALMGIFLFGSLLLVVGALTTLVRSDFVALLAAFILLITPFYLGSFLYKRYKELVINNSYYGKARFNIELSVREISRLFFKVSLIFLISSAVIFGVISGILFGLKLFLNPSAAQWQFLIGIGGAVSYMIVLAFIKGVSDGYFSNYIRNNTTLEGAPFKGEINEIKLGFISLSNSLMLLFSLGLLYPYAKIRYLREKIENSYFACSDFERFEAQSEDSISTIGEEAVDFFDIDIGI